MSGGLLLKNQRYAHREPRIIVDRDIYQPLVGSHLHGKVLERHRFQFCHVRHLVNSLKVEQPGQLLMISYCPSGSESVSARLIAQK